MTDSHFHPTEELLSRMTTPYAKREDGGTALPKTNLFTIGDEYESGGAALISNVPDYARFADAMANGGVGETGKSILLPNTIDLMRENRVGNLMETDCSWPQLAGYGYGFGVRTLISRGAGGSLSSLGEFGWDGAKGVYVVIDPSRKLSLTYAEHRGGDKYLVQPRLRNLAYACLDLD
jgi:CubicO group peptidase (beta-lactamase class C family)